MPASPVIRASIAIASFAIAAAAAWFTSPAPASAASKELLEIVAANAPRDGKNAVGKKAPDKSPAAASASFERTLAGVLHPAFQGPFTGEHLDELCSDSSTVAMITSHPGISYARAWANQAPQQMFDWLQKQKRLTAGHFLLTGTLFSAWAGKDPDAALHAAAQCPSQLDRADALTSIIGTLRKSDPARATAVTAENLPLLARENVAGFYAPQDKQAFRDDWSFLTKLPPGNDRGAVMAKYLRSALNGGEPNRAVEFWHEIPAGIRLEMIAGEIASGGLGESAFIGDWSGLLTGVEELQRNYIEQSGNPALAGEFLDKAGTNWALRDPEAAITWAQKNLKGAELITATAELFGPAAKKHCETALSLWQSLPEGPLRARAAGHIAASVPPEHQEEADALIESLSPADRRLAESARRDAAPDSTLLPVPPDDDDPPPP